MKKYSILYILISIAIGGIGGYLYFHFWGCDGTCAITSSPWKSSLYGMVMGYLGGQLFEKKEKNEKKEA